ncbi:hypothetical protein PHYNN_233 [Pantoea phage Phynn]|nr:hypothetical protein PHYNN_233 [Pantoea phage Phynn]
MKAMHVKKSGMMIFGKLVSETDTYWEFHATDEKRPKKVKKNDPTQTVFVAGFSFDAPWEWLETANADDPKKARHFREMKEAK